jgi:hypothetical protein
MTLMPSEPPVGEQQIGDDQAGRAERRRRAPLPGGEAGTPPTDAAAPARGAPPAERRRKSDDPAAPVPRRAAVQPTGVTAYAVGMTLRFLRRASDELPEMERLPPVDVVTPELRERIRQTEATAAQSRAARLARWRLGLLAVLGVAVVLGLGWLLLGW